MSRQFSLRQIIRGMLGPIYEHEARAQYDAIQGLQQQTRGLLTQLQEQGQAVQALHGQLSQATQTSQDQQRRIQEQEKTIQELKTKADESSPSWFAPVTIVASLAGVYAAVLAQQLSSTEPRSHALLAGAGLLFAGLCVYITWFRLGLRRRWQRLLMSFLPSAYFGILIAVQFFQATSQWSDQSSNNALEADKTAITNTIIDVTGSMVRWYQNPAMNEPNDMKNGVLAHGPLISQVMGIIAIYRTEHHHWASIASRALSVDTVYVMPDRRTAYAKTYEVWFQPVVDSKGREIKLPPTLLNIASTQAYNLIKLRGHWIIESNPIPLSQ